MTNTKILTQIAYATPTGDRIICQADSHELKRFGLTAGLTNYSAAYCTGLLCARRVLKELKLDKLYEGEVGDEVNGEYVDIYMNDGEYIDDEKRPFKCILDVGLTRTTTGNKVFGAMKGLSDGGVHIPHNHKRFPGHKVILPEEKGEKKTETYDPEVHRKKIFGFYIQEHMEDLKEDKTRETNKQQYNLWEKCLKANKLTNLEDLYKKVHEQIRKNPDRVVVKKTKNPVVKTDATKTIMADSKGNKWFRARKTTTK